MSGAQNKLLSVLVPVHETTKRRPTFGSPMPCGRSCCPRPVHVNTHRFGGGRPRVPDRPFADAIFYVLRTGCQWQALDQTELVPHSTAHDRYQAWVQGDGFELWKAGVEQFDELQGIDWSFSSMDGVMTKAPLGGEKTGPDPTYCGKDGVKRSLLTEGHGVPIGLVVAGANRTDMKLVRATLESIIVERPEPTPDQPQGVCLDKGYDYQEVRDTLAEFGFTGHIRDGRKKPQAIKPGGAGLPCTALGGRTHTQLDEPLSAHPHPLGEETGRTHIVFLHFACALIAFRAAGLFG